jgi:glycosyltransferase involved in cell wall biosynthesis
LRSQQIEIVQTYFNDSNKVGIVAAICAGTPSVISSRRNQGYWHTPTEVFLSKVLNRWVNIFVANSFSTKIWAKTVEGIAEEKIRVIYNGFDLKAVQNDSDGHNRLEYRKAWRVPEDSKVVGLVANLRPVKRHDIFLRAAQLVASQYPETRFVIVGEGDERQNLEQLANELRISDAVLFLGQRDDVVAIVRAMDIGVLSSDSESFSNAVVEYLAASLPVVTTDVGGSQEAIESGKNGYIVPVGDFTAMAEALCRILHENRRAEMGKISRMKAESLFSMESMVKQYENLYVSMTR